MHGAQKLFSWFGGHGMAGTAGYFESIGFKPGHMYASAAGLGEFVSGILVALGLFGPVGPALMLAVMIVAMGSVHWTNGLFATSNGVELPMLYGATGAALALTGPGAVSCDAAFGLGAYWTPELASTALLIAIAGGLASLAVRRPQITV
jgi:putative oxidoreductase